MPELPEVETVCQALRPVLERDTFVCIQANRPDLRYPLPLNLESVLIDQSIIGVKRRAKYLLIDFMHGKTLIWHLGMSGQVIIHHLKQPITKQTPHDHVIFTTAQHYQIIYRDPRRFGFLQLIPTSQLNTTRPFHTLGPEPLDNPALTPQELYTALKNRKVSLKSALLDQKIIAGVGNIYASESLWQAKLSPFRQTDTLTLGEVVVLLRELQDVLRRAIVAGGSTLRDHVRPNGEIGYFQHSFKVYGREHKPCEGCFSPLLKVMQNGRATYYCKACQR
jgi:formamidopyrimidine-DNA glycosylase